MLRRGAHSVEDQQISTILWRHRLIVLICVALGVGMAVLATVLADKEFEARAIIQAGSIEEGSAGASADANEALARSYAEVLMSGSFLERVRPRIDGGGLSIRELQERIEAKAITDTAVIRLSARAASPEAASRMADVVTSGFLAALRADSTSRLRRQQAAIDSEITRVTRRIRALLDSGASPGVVEQLRESRRALREQYTSLIATGVADAASARRIGPASASIDPVSPRPLLNLLAGLLLGSLLGAGLAWLRERRAPSLQSAEHAGVLAEVPVLASVPLRRRVVEGDPVVGEAYDILRANLTFQSRDRGLRVVTVLSQNAQVGKTSTVEGLAYAAARGGSSVVVVDADLRMGTLSQRLGYGGRRGLRDAVGGERTVDELLIELAPGLALLPAHAPTANPPSLLYSPGTRDVLAALRERFDIVVIDSPPIGQLADGLILSALSDGVVMVARTGVTSRQDLLTGVAKVRQTHTPLIGLVVFDAVAVDEEYYPATTRSRPPVADEALTR